MMKRLIIGMALLASAAVQAAENVEDNAVVDKNFGGGGGGGGFHPGGGGGGGGYHPGGGGGYNPGGGGSHPGGGGGGYNPGGGGSHPGGGGYHPGGGGGGYNPGGGGYHPGGGYNPGNPGGWPHSGWNDAQRWAHWGHWLRGGWYGGPTGVVSEFYCGSPDGSLQTCYVPGYVQEAWIVEQFSGPDCIEGNTWGTNDDGVWVAGYCQAEFHVVYTP